MPRKLSSDSEQTIVSRYLAGASLEALAAEFGCSAGAVRNALIRSGTPRRGSGRQAKPRSPTKVCSSCTLDLPRLQFYGEGRKTSQCRLCFSEMSAEKYLTDPSFRETKIAQAKKWQDEHPKESRTRKRAWASGWTAALFESAWVRQEGRCAICQVPMLDGGCANESVAADHDHGTGHVRELLCAKCNRHLGIFERNLDAFTAYLKKHGVVR